MRNMNCMRAKETDGTTKTVLNIAVVCEKKGMYFYARSEK